MREVTIYTDGSSNNQKRDAGWSFCVYSKEGETLHETYGYVEGTNNVAELLGVINGLEYVRGHLLKTKKVIVYTDSKYVSDTVYFDYYKWYEKDWKTKDATGKLVDRTNKDLWIRLRNVIHLMKMRGISVEIRWVRGHKGVVGNERADRLAVFARQSKFYNHLYE